MCCPPTPPSPMNHPCIILMHLMFFPPILTYIIKLKVSPMLQDACRAYGKYLSPPPLHRSGHWPLISYPRLTKLNKLTEGSYANFYYRFSRELSGGNRPRLAPCLPITFYTYTDPCTHSWGNLLLFWTPLYILIISWMFLMHPIGQVSQFDHPTPMLPLPQFSLFWLLFWMHFCYPLHSLL